MKTASYGSWLSPITTDFITSKAIGIGQIVVDGDNIYWSELQAWDKGRSVVVVRRNPDGETNDVTQDGFNVRSRVHEYGGGSSTVADGTVYFSNFIDQRLYWPFLVEVQEDIHLSLCALKFRDTFKAGASYYDVSDLEALARDTYKFESRYLDRLVGAYPEMKELYEKRSPINYAEGLTCPVVFLQGLEDKIVPPNQAETMIDVLLTLSHLEDRRFFQA